MEEVVSFKGIQERHVHTAERCLDGMYWCLICLVCASHIVIRPSCVVMASSCPVGLNFSFSFADIAPAFWGRVSDTKFADPFDVGTEATVVILEFCERKSNCNQGCQDLGKILGFHISCIISGYENQLWIDTNNFYTSI